MGPVAPHRQLHGGPKRHSESDGHLHVIRTNISEDALYLEVASICAQHIVRAFKYSF